MGSTAMRRSPSPGSPWPESAKDNSLTPYELVAQASRPAIADAGLTKADIDGVGSTALGTMAPDRRVRVPRHPAPLARLDRRRWARRGK